MPRLPLGKAPPSQYQAVIGVAMNEGKGKNALALSRAHAGWVLMHKVREAMAEEFKSRKMGGDGKVTGMDGAFFVGYVRPAMRRKPLSAKMPDSMTTALKFAALRSLP